MNINELRKLHAEVVEVLMNAEWDDLAAPTTKASLARDWEHELFRQRRALGPEPAEHLLNKGVRGEINKMLTEIIAIGNVSHVLMRLSSEVGETRRARMQSRA